MLRNSVARSGAGGARLLATSARQSTALPRPAIAKTLPTFANRALAPAIRHYSVTNPSQPIGGPVFDPDAVTAMDKQTPPAPGKDFNVVIVGAGNINFGSDEGPWNHSFRLEQ